MHTGHADACMEEKSRKAILPEDADENHHHEHQRSDCKVPSQSAITE